MLSKDEIVSELICKVTLQKSPVSTSTFIDTVKNCDFVPTFVFDVERGGTEDQQLGVAAVRGIAKELCRHAKVIIVLSEANAVLEFGRDADREEYLYVGEMEKNEALDLMKTLNISASESVKEDLLSKVGVFPSRLAWLSVIHTQRQSYAKRR